MDRNFFIVVVIGAIVIVGLGWYFANTGTDSDMEDMATTTEQTQKMNEDEEGTAENSISAASSNNVVENAANEDNLTTFVAAIQNAAIANALSSESGGPFTVFAPNDNAFDALSAGTLESLLQTENRGQLQSVLEYHVVAGEITTADIEDGSTFETLNGQQITISIDAEGDYIINDSAMIETADIVSSNGVVHVIDSVLLPEEESTEDEAAAEDA